MCTNPSLPDQRKTPECNLQLNYVTSHTPTSTKSATCSCFHLCEITVIDSSNIKCYLRVGTNESYAKLLQISKFPQWQKCLSVNWRAGFYLWWVQLTMAGHGRYVFPESPKTFLYWCKDYWSPYYMENV